MLGECECSFTILFKHKCSATLQHARSYDDTWHTRLVATDRLHPARYNKSICTHKPQPPTPHAHTTLPKQNWRASTACLLGFVSTRPFFSLVVLLQQMLASFYITPALLHTHARALYTCSYTRFLLRPSPALSLSSSIAIVQRILVRTPKSFIRKPFYL